MQRLRCMISLAYHRWVSVAEELLLAEVAEQLLEDAVIISAWRRRGARHVVKDLPVFQAVVRYALNTACRGKIYGNHLAIFLRWQEEG